MNKQMLCGLTALSLSLLLFTAGCNNAGTGQKPALSAAALKTAAECEQRAYDYLVKSQAPNGAWKFNPAITALVLNGLAEQPDRPTTQEAKAAIAKGYKYLEGFVKPDGGIYDKSYQHYSTAVALMAFVALEDPQYAAIIKNAKDFLIEQQCDESENYTPEHAYYGGIGYGGDDRPDLSNTHLALEAIKFAERYAAKFKLQAPRDEKELAQAESDQGLHWQKALVFLARCQNLASVNQMPYRRADDGGFMYETGNYKEERSHSYGSMTYAGVKSLLYAHVDKSDERVQKAFAWIRQHYTLDDNPGFGTTSLYYYYMTFAKCLYLFGNERIRDAAGTEHNWREDLIAKLASLQTADGSWVNSDGRYWENINELATAYCLLALKFATKDLPPAGTQS
jgi:squalene-hopene/tetraprenyl-beta-curcumene cyclase